MEQFVHFSLFSVTTGNFNTAVGAVTFDLNQADSNTATALQRFVLTLRARKTQLWEPLHLDSTIRG